MRTRLTLLAALAGALLASAALASSASGAIVISRIYYNSPGADNGANANLNKEWIRIRNTGASARALTGWRIRDAAGHTYRFSAFTLQAGKWVTVHTGSGTNTAAHRYWGQSYYVWNNDQDTARLRSAAGILVDTCAYNNSSAAQKVC